MLWPCFRAGRGGPSKLAGERAEFGLAREDLAATGLMEAAEGLEREGRLREGRRRR